MGLSMYRPVFKLAKVIAWHVSCCSAALLSVRADLHNERCLFQKRPRFNAHGRVCTGASKKNDRSHGQVSKTELFASNPVRRICLQLLLMKVLQVCRQRFKRKRRGADAEIRV